MFVYTTFFGRTDALAEPRCRADWQFVCCTDQAITSKRWLIRRLPVLDRPKRECRKYKHQPHIVFPRAEISLWIDCNFTLTMPPEEVARLHAGPIAAFRHHKRNRILDEAQAIINSGKGQRDTVMAQLEAYQRDGWDTDDSPQQAIHNGGFLLRRHTPEMIRFMDAWHHEVQTRTLRDQMSFDYVAHKHGIQIDELHGTVRRNPYAVLATTPGKPTNDF